MDELLLQLEAKESLRMGKIPYSKLTNLIELSLSNYYH